MGTLGGGKQFIKRNQHKIRTKINKMGDNENLSEDDKKEV
jgi:hypothetical protein